MAIPGGQGVKIVGKVIRKGSGEMESEAGRIIGLPDRNRQGVRKCLQRAEVIGIGRIDQEGYGWEGPDRRTKRLQGIQYPRPAADWLKEVERARAGGVHDEFSRQGQVLAKCIQGIIGKGDKIKIGGRVDIREAGRVGAAERPGESGCTAFIPGDDLEQGVARSSDGFTQNGGDISGTDNNGLHTVSL